LADFIATVIFHGSLGALSVVIRMCRLLRILRLFRLFKMFKQLYMLASGFVDSSVAVFWVSVLCALMIYVCAVFLTRTLGQQADLDSSQNEAAKFYTENFGSVFISMFTLFELMADPGHLGAMKPAMFANPIMMCFFIMFIVFGSFAMLSILTGVISEGMIEKGNAHKEEMRFAEERSKQVFMEELRQYFLQSDADGDGTMTRDEFNQSLPQMMNMFEAHGFCYQESDLQMVFDLVDFDKGGTIELEEFLQGMTSFTGNVTDTPLQVLRLQSNVFMHIEKMELNIHKRIDGINGKFGTMEDRLKLVDDELTALIQSVR